MAHLISPSPFTILILRSTISFFTLINNHTHFNLLTTNNNKIVVIPPQTIKLYCECLKQELIETIAPLDRGADATSQQQERVDQIARKLEAVNKVKEPLKYNLLNGKWELLYTTSQSILQTKRPKILRANGKIYQAINADTLRAQNMETWPFFNQATANLVPLDAKRVAIKFDAFKCSVWLVKLCYYYKNQFILVIHRFNFSKK
ncbi:hypothetical protein L1987_55033 [Smallanthus sonchifolius]|uniref:Uncharacterized protein n=1 Tax=Smallanthus sonchifolius TaxID=185202 RepID=A0ACB9E8T1_9ASTR|nr:hypothetical protein L1987_55033 [Smallanthus sonchifolius]